jgi:FlaG/FlaF family flagellin (archaellin)
MVMKKGFTEQAVSPVVGVMLMLVVTIIIAAVVSSFGTGLTGDVDTASNARVELVGVSSGGYKDTAPPQWTYAQIGVVFKNAGGDSLDLRNLKFYITGLAWGSQGAFTLTYNDPVSLVYVEDSGHQSAAGKSRVTLPKEATGYRMQRFGSGLTPEELEDPIIEPGDRFIIYCEYYAPGGQLGFRVDRGNPDNPTDTWSSGAITVDGSSQYTLSDLKSGVVYSEGYLDAEHIF